jgi:hypothetical protein
MARYAANTDVTSSSSRDEIERTLSRYGATGFMYGWTEQRAVVAFQAHDRRVQFTLPMPDRNDRRFTHTPAKDLPRSASAAAKEYDQAVRQRWRALSLVVKAKLEAVESGITTFDDEFMAHIVLPHGGTVGEWMAPQIREAYETGTVPALLPGVSGELPARSS